MSSTACQCILSVLVKNRSLNIRTLLKCQQKNVESNRVIKMSKRTIYVDSIPCLAVFEFITSMYGSTIEIEKCLSELKTSYFDRSDTDNILDVFIILADYDKNCLTIGDYSCNGIEYHINEHVGVSYFLTSTSLAPSTNVDINTIIKK